MDDNAIFSAEHWRGRAEEARTIADGLHDAQAKRTMLSVAAGYERLSVQAAQRELRGKA